MKIFVYQIFIAVLFYHLSLFAGDRYWVFLRDKGENENFRLGKKQQLIHRYVNERALQRRQLRGFDLPSIDAIQKDLPLDQNYLNILENMGFQIHAQSRWLNAVSGVADAKVIDQIKNLPFVNSIEKVKSWSYRREVMSEEQGEIFNKSGERSGSMDWGYGTSYFQNEFHQIPALHQKGLNGHQVLIGVFDTGFSLINHALTHIPSKLIAEFDFIQMDSVTANQTGDASNQDRHGTLVLSILAGFLPDSLIGPAFGADFILAKTEIVDQEIHLEEDNWAMAAEWAEGLGVDIVSSSLGYSEFDPGQGSYTYEDMDGKTTIITQAANELARRGVLVVSSAGNEGSTPWHYITAPADAPYAVAVGAVNSKNIVSSFSSHGPTADERVKPDVVALGEGVFCATPGTAFTMASGTSVSCPLVAGIAAQLLQSKPDLNVLELLTILRNCSDNANSPDNDRGWGTVNAMEAWNLINRTPIEDYRVLPPLPNPSFSSHSTVFFRVELPAPASIQLEIFSILGQKIYQEIFTGSASQNIISWPVRRASGDTVSAGIYIYRISAGLWTHCGKLTVLN